MSIDPPPFPNPSGYPASPPYQPASPPDPWAAAPPAETPDEDRSPSPAAAIPPAPVAGPTNPWGAGRAAVLGALVGGLVASLVATSVYLLVGRDTTRTIVKEVRPTLQIIHKPLDIQGLLTKVRPSVVSIHTGAASVSGSDAEAAGSGVVLSADGLVLTNAHVIENATTIEVSFADGQRKEAKLVGSFPDNDVALIKAVDISGQTPAELGNSDDLQVGDDVVAIGNALNLGAEPTVTKGIVSALDRPISAPGVELEHLIQTDAAINPGNSGGPLVNAAGQVVGINTAIIPNSQSLGFSLAINELKPLIDDLEAGKGTVNSDTPFLGVQTTDISEQQQSLLDRYGVKVRSGAFVVGVASGSAAAGAGLVEGDVITKIDGADVSGKDAVGSIVRRHRPGDQITIEYLRNGATRQGTTKLGRKGG